VNAGRCLLLFAGPNGSGKSTVTTPATLARFGIPENRYINADDIARRLVAEQPDTLQEERERIAFRQARDRRRTYREGGISFAFETVFSHPSTLLDMAKCQAAGFEIIVLFVTTDDPAINVARVAGRVQSGGHAVPEDRIRSRYTRAMSLLPRIIEDADRAFVYDNSRETPILFPFVQGTALPTRDPLPAFLHARLHEPLEQRATERQVIADTLGATTLPDEEGGTYTGALRWLSDHYAVQETSDSLVRHDRLLLSLHASIGNTVTVSYQEGAGAVTP
jgi:predicted ABC-type ATPase